MKTTGAHLFQFLFLLSVIVILSTTHLTALEKKKSRKANEVTITEPSSEIKAENKLQTMEKAIANCIKYEGLFTFFQDTTNGNLKMLIRYDQLDKEYIYFANTVDGPVEAYAYRGMFRDNKVISIKKYYNKIEFVHENIGFYFDPENPIAKSSGANISASILSTQPIVARDSIKNEYLIQVDAVFLTESLQVVKPIPNGEAKPGQFFSLGDLSKDKSKYLKVNNYPENTDIIVELTFDNPTPLHSGGPGITDPRTTSIRLQHSLIELPENNYQVRYDDPRIGYFTHQVNDLTSIGPVNYRDPIRRWHLEKKDKNAPLSEPVVPIVFWIENSTPVEIRETIKKAGLTWNEAFEKAGFKNALQIKIQPDDADWDAGDIRFNVLRWTSSPTPLFNGYGPSFVNPRTGQILGADIMFEYNFIKNRHNYAKLYDTPNVGEQFARGNDNHFCSFGHQLHQNNQYGHIAHQLLNAEEADSNELFESALYFLIIHEIGHTLGLNHNMKSSQLYSMDEIHNKSLTSKTGLIGSIMDYPAINVSRDPAKQGQYYTMKPGPYDFWAIEYGYSESLPNPDEEKERLEKILARSTEPQLMFGNDADDMRRPGFGIDPRTMIYDLSSDAISHSVHRIELTNDLLSMLKEKYSKHSNQSYQELESSFNYLVKEINTSAQVISRYIGGVFVDRSYTGQITSEIPLKPVDYKDQKRAMNSLHEHVFGPSAIKIPSDLPNYLQKQRRGFSHYGKPEDPKINELILEIHKSVLAHVLHPTVMKRITDSESYGNQYKLPEFMADLTNAIFKEDLNSKVNSFRQNLQGEYVTQLIQVAGLESKSDHDFPSKSQAAYQLKSIKTMLTKNVGPDAATKGHREHLIYLVDKAMAIK